MSRPHTRSQTDVRSDHQTDLVRDELLQTSEGDTIGGDTEEAVTPPPHSSSTNVRAEENDSQSAELPSSPPPYLQEESVQRWMTNYNLALQDEQDLIRDHHFPLRGDNLTVTARSFQELVEDFKKLPLDAMKDPQVRSFRENVKSKLSSYNTQKLHEADCRERERREEQQLQRQHEREINTTTQQQVSVPLPEDNYFRQKDSVERLPKFYKDVIRYATWRGLFKRAIQKRNIQDEGMIITWMENNILPELSIDMQQPLSQEETVDGWLRMLDQRFRSQEYVKAQATALKRSLLERRDIFKTSSNIYQHDEDLTRLIEIIRIGDDILEQLQRENQLFSRTMLSQDYVDALLSALPFRVREDVKKEVQAEYVWPHENLKAIQAVIKREAESRRLAEFNSSVTIGRQEDKPANFRHKSPNKKPHDNAREVSVKMNNVNTTPPHRSK